MKKAIFAIAALCSIMVQAMQYDKKTNTLTEHINMIREAYSGKAHIDMKYKKSTQTTYAEVNHPCMGVFYIEIKNNLIKEINKVVHADAVGKSFKFETGDIKESTKYTDLRCYNVRWY